MAWTEGTENGLFNCSSINVIFFFIFSVGLLWHLRPVIYWLTCGEKASEHGVDAKGLCLERKSSVRTTLSHSHVVGRQRKASIRTGVSLRLKTS